MVYSRGLVLKSFKNESTSLKNEDMSSHYKHFLTMTWSMLALHRTSQWSSPFYQNGSGGPILFAGYSLLLLSGPKVGNMVPVDYSLHACLDWSYYLQGCWCCLFTWW